MKLLWLVLLLLLATPVQAALRYQGEETLWQDTVWEGEVLIDGILTVAPEVRLEIRPGTTIRFSFADSNDDGIGENELFIQGVLDARGTASQPIRFTAAGPQPFAGYWGAINMLATEVGNRFEHCIVEYAYRGFHAHFGQGEIVASLFRHNLRAFQFQDSSVRIIDSRLEDNFNGIQFRESKVFLENSIVSGGEWGIRGVYSELTLNGCLVENNRTNGISLRDSKLQLAASLVRQNRKGVYLQRSEGTLTRNLIVANAEHGIFFEDSKVRVNGNRITGNGRAAVRWLNSRGQLQNNDLSDNAEYALINDGESTVAAGGNWWGTTDPGQLDWLIRDASDRPLSGPVDFGEPLTAAPEFILPEVPLSTFCFGE